MYFQKPGRISEKPGTNSENMEQISKMPMATLLKLTGKNYFEILHKNTQIILKQIVNI